MRRLATAALLVVNFASAPARSQDMPDLNELALVWAQGAYGVPMLCEFEDATRRLLRRVEIRPGPRHLRPRTDAVRFRGLDDMEATRCVSEMGEPELNVTGALQIRLESHSRPDIADHDFKAGLRRDGGFEFTVATGRARVGPVGEPLEKQRVVEFAGGLVRLTIIEPNSDDARILAAYPSPRYLRLEIEAKDGTKLSFRLVQLGP